MPHQKWHRIEMCWYCDLTPASAWRICNSSDPGFDCYDELARIASEFEQALQDQGMLPPPLRVTDLWDHQASAFAFSMVRDGVLLNHWMGLGKSLVAVSLLVNKGCKKTLVLCPTAVRGVWRREMHKVVGQAGRSAGARQEELDGPEEGCRDSEVLGAVRGQQSAVRGCD